MIRVTTSQTGFERIRAQLALMTRKQANLARVLAGPINRLLENEFSKQFTTFGRRFGTPWARNTETTKELKRKAGYRADRVGRMTDRLFRAYTHKSSPDAYLKVTARTIERGSTLPYEKFFTEGWVMRSMFGRPLRRPRHIPPRPIVPKRLPLGVSSQIARMMEKEMAKGLKP